MDQYVILVEKALKNISSVGCYEQSGIQVYFKGKVRKFKLLPLSLQSNYSQTTKTSLDMFRKITSMVCCTVTVFAACACISAETNDTSADEKGNNKTLVAYFSAQGHTKSLAENVASVTGGDLFEIEPSQPYTEEDLDGWNESARGTRESKDRTTRPEIKNKVENIAQYDTIYLGFPIWWYTAPTIINTFLDSYNTEGKVIIPFATSGGSEIGETEKDLRVSAPKAIFKPGKVMNNYSEKQVAEWVNSLQEK